MEQVHTTYFICATPRTGSFLLSELLSNTNLAGRPNEYFGLGQETFFLNQWKISNYRDYVAKVIEVSTTPNGVFGTKILSLFFEDFVRNLRKISGQAEVAIPDLLSPFFPNAHYIWLRRRDKVRQAVSYWRARQTLAWTSFKPEMNKPVFNLQEIDTCSQKIERDEIAWQQYFNDNNICPCLVEYEELTSIPEATIIRILQSLNIALPEKLILKEPRLQKQADVLSDTWVEHYYKLKQVPKCLSE